MNKERKTKNLKDKKFTKAGFTLLFASLVSALLLSIGLSIFNIVYKQLIISSIVSNSHVAFTSADTAAECALFWDLQYPGYEGSVFGGASQILVPNGLVGYWRMDEGAGTSVSDSAGSNNGTRVNMSSGSWVDGRVNKALNFDGVNDYVSIPDSSSLSFSNDQLTIAAWVNLDSLQAGERAIVRKNNQWQLGLFPAEGKIRNLVRTNGINGWVATNDQDYTFQTGQWYHLAFIYDGSAITFFVNGGQIGPSKSVTGTIVDSSNSVAIGANTDGTILNLDGVIDEARVYRRALSSAEIDFLAEQTTPETTGPTGSGLLCDGQDITNNWLITNVSPSTATVEFDLSFAGGRCANVTVNKDGATTTIESRGYNTCTLSDPRRVERGLKITY